MGYLFLCIALFAGLTKGYCGKRTSGYTSGLREALAANTIRMVLCILVGFVLIWAQGDLAQLAVSPATLAISALSGVFTAVFVVSWLLAVKKGAYMLVEVFLMLGVLIPMVLGKLLFSETIRPNQWIGMGILVAATLVMCSYNNSQKQKLTAAALVLLVLCGVGNGLADFSQKLFVRTQPDTPASVFNFYTYVFSGAVMAAAFFLLGNRSRSEIPLGQTVKKIVGFIAVMALCLFANSYFKTLAATRQDSAQLYPLNQGAALILSMGMSAVFFKEKVTPKAVLGVVLAFVGLIVMNVL